MITTIPLTIFEAKLKRSSRVISEGLSNSAGLGTMIGDIHSKEPYFSRYASDFAQTDDEYQRLIRSLRNLRSEGTPRGNGTSSKESSNDENSLRKVQQKDISETFTAGASCTSLYETHEKRYYEFSTKNSNLEALAEVLSDDMSGGTVSTQNTCLKATENEFPEESKAVQEINALIRSAMVPMSCAEVHNKLWHIPLDTIKRYLRTSKPNEFVRVGRDTYFYVSNFPAASKEIEHIRHLIANQLERNNFITVDELHDLIEQDLPYVSLDNFTVSELSNSLSFILKANFSFNGAVISSLSNPMNIDAVFKDFCNSRDELSMRELESFAEKVNASNIRWHAVQEIMLRVSESRFVKNNQIDFPITEVDLAIKDLLGDLDYRPLKDLDIFVHFPNVGYSWNRYLLESYIAGYSWRFRLIHTGYTKKEGYSNAVVIARSSSSIKNFKNLITTVLAKSDLWHTRNDALDLLVGSGYLSSRKFAGIDSVISDANALRKKFSTKFSSQEVIAS